MSFVLVYRGGGWTSTRRTALGSAGTVRPGHLRSFLTLRPDNPITETGVLSEFSHHPVASRFGAKRADLAHQSLDPIIVVAPWVVGGGVVYLGIRGLWRAAVRKRR